MQSWKVTRIVGLFAALSLASGQYDSKAQTLDEAIVSAWENNPAIARAKALVLRAEGGVDQSNANYKPTITLTGQASTSDRDARLQNGASFSESLDPLSTTLRIDQSLYTSGLRHVESKQARLGVETREFELAADRRRLALEVAQATSRVIIADQAILIAAGRVERNQTQVDAERERYRLGTGTETGIYFVEARAAEALSAIARSRSDMLTARQSFEQITGLSPIKPTWLQNQGEMPETLEEAVSDALLHAPEIEAARRNYDISTLSIKSAKKRYGPQVGLAFEASSSRQNSPTIDQDDELRASLTVSIPLYSASRPSAEKKQAHADQSAALADIRALVQQVELRVYDTWYRRKAAYEQRQAAEHGLVAAQKALEGVEMGRNAGLWSITDLLDASDQLAEAELALLEARSAVDLTEFELLLLTGRLAGGSSALGN